nr:glycine-rich RNA-binding protein 3, mitochondrial-like [Arachis hypogaea]
MSESGLMMRLMHWKGGVVVVEERGVMAVEELGVVVEVEPGVEGNGKKIRVVVETRVVMVDLMAVTMGGDSGGGGYNGGDKRGYRGHGGGHNGGEGGSGGGNFGGGSDDGEGGGHGGGGDGGGSGGDAGCQGDVYGCGRYDSYGDGGLCSNGGGGVVRQRFGDYFIGVPSSDVAMHESQTYISLGEMLSNLLGSEGLDAEFGGSCFLDKISMIMQEDDLARHRSQECIPDEMEHDRDRDEDEFSKLSSENANNNNLYNGHQH